MTQIDSPGSIFDAGVNRGAAIVVGIAALALISDGFAAPNLHTGLSGKLAAAQWRVRAFARAILRGESADPIQSANLLREITALRPDITALVAELSRRMARAARQPGAPPWHWLPRSAQRPHWHRSPPRPCHLFAARLPMPSAGTATPCSCACSSARIAAMLTRTTRCSSATPRISSVEDRRAQDAIEDLRAGRHPARDIRAPIYRSRRAAVRNGLRAFLAVVISAILFSLGGWPLASQGVALVGVTIALSANTPNPGAFAAAAVIAMPIAALLAGVTEFLILDGVDQFPLLAIGMAPSRPRRRPAVHDSQSETGPDRAPAARLLSGDALPDEPAELQPRDLSVLQFPGDHVGHPAVRSAADAPPGVRRASAALVPDIGANGDARGPGRSPIPAPG